MFAKTAFDHVTIGHLTDKQGNVSLVFFSWPAGILHSDRHTTCERDRHEKKSTWFINILPYFSQSTAPKRVFSASVVPLDSMRMGLRLKNKGNSSYG